MPRKRFIVGVEPAASQSDELFADYLNHASARWWHWIEGLWLVVDNNGQLTAEAIRDTLQDTHPELSTMVIELREDGSSTWSGFGPSDDDDNMFTWMHKNWRRRSAVNDVNPE